MGAADDSRETYIHRLGRTGRAGKRGQGLLILPELEQDFLEDLEGLEILLMMTCKKDSRKQL
jgi:superfamily II DNA/RNA helicase